MGSESVPGLIGELAVGHVFVDYVGSDLIWHERIIWGRWNRTGRGLLAALEPLSVAATEDEKREATGATFACSSDFAGCSRGSSSPLRLASSLKRPPARISSLGNVRNGTMPGPSRSGASRTIITSTTNTTAATYTGHTDGLALRLSVSLSVFIGLRPLRSKRVLQGRFVASTDLLRESRGLAQSSALQSVWLPYVPRLSSNSKVLLKIVESR